MNGLSVKLDSNSGAPVKCCMTNLDDLMVSTERYGKLAVSRIGDTWWARIEMNTNATGASFKIESDGSSKCPHTPLQAVQQCIERMHAALKTLGVDK